jgi:hypothetical protein
MKKTILVVSAIGLLALSGLTYIYVLSCQKEAQAASVGKTSGNKEDCPVDKTGCCSESKTTAKN